MLEVREFQGSEKGTAFRVGNRAAAGVGAGAARGKRELWHWSACWVKAATQRQSGDWGGTQRIPTSLPGV